MRQVSILALVTVCAVGCAGERGKASGPNKHATGDGGENAATETTGDQDDESETGGPHFDPGPPRFDVAQHETPGSPTECKVGWADDAIGACEEQAPLYAFEPEVQWSWSGENGYAYTFVTPLVANLTDDNQDGEIDLCDTPDVLVSVYKKDDWSVHPRYYVLDGATGEPHYYLSGAGGHHSVTPAIGDIDGDGKPEIVGALPFEVGSGVRIAAWEYEGSQKWVSDLPIKDPIGAIGLADVDNDGDVEIYAADVLMDHEGKRIWERDLATPLHPATTAADLDGDGDLEIIVGHAALHHDGTQYYKNWFEPGYPQVADLDEDGLPEVLLMNMWGITVLEHDGTTKYHSLRPTGDSYGHTNWRRPAVIHDMDGDGSPEFAASSVFHYTLYEPDASIVWMADVKDGSGVAAGTAFDFLGAGKANAMYADETLLHVYDSGGSEVLKVSRTSRTAIEYPVVADVDNDGSAEIVVGSSDSTSGLDDGSPTIQVIRDKEDRWVQSRRIWNQHTYHVTNVREDASIPRFERPNWELFNSFRTNSQVEAGTDCIPEG